MPSRTNLQEKGVEILSSQSLHIVLRRLRGTAFSIASENCTGHEGDTAELKLMGAEGRKRWRMQQVMMYKYICSIFTI